MHTEDKDEKLLREYESLVLQIIHWDSHFWTKSRFFLAIESAFIVVALQIFKLRVLGELESHSTLMVVLIFVGLLNIYLCYVWFRTNRRNREYLRIRFKRARAIENKFDEALQTFTDEKKELHERHGSATWETHLATAFIIAWILLLAGAGFLRVS